MAMMMKRVAKSAVQAFALGSTSSALTRNLHRILWTAEGILPDLLVLGVIPLQS